MADDFEHGEKGDSQPTPPATDLLGAPWAQLPDPRGRRKLRFKPEVYGRVREMKAGGMPDADIAKALGLGKATVQRHFGPELASGTAQVRAEVLTAAMDKVRDGSVAAMKFVWALLEKGDAQIPAAAPAPRPQPLGKKEQLAADARSVDRNSAWGRTLQ